MPMTIKESLENIIVSSESPGHAAERILEMLEAEHKIMFLDLGPSERIRPLAATFVSRGRCEALSRHREQPKPQA